MERPEMPFGFVRFESKVRRHNDFKDWYDHILSQTDMAKFLEDVGVLRPLQYAPLMDVDRSPVDLSFLLSRWSSHSHTFVAAWGEFSPPLEDVVFLTGLSMFGVHHAVDVLNGEGERMLGLLHNAMERAKYISNKLTYLSWMTFFVKGEGRNAEFQLAAFFAYWLSYFVFPSPPDDGLNPFMFRMAVLLAQKKPVALGPWFLGSLYKSLDECGRNITRSVGRFDVVCYVEANFLQLYLWERFASIAPVPTTFAPVPAQRVQGVLKVDASLLRVRGTRWFGVKRPDQSGVPLREVIDEEDQFTFRTYSSAPAGVLPNLIYPARSGLTQLRPMSSVSLALKNLLAVVLPTSLPLRSEEGDDLVAYNPHRFLRQFGFDQGAVVETGKVCSGMREAKNQYTRAGRDRLFEDRESMYWPSLSRGGVRSLGGIRHWSRCTALFKDFVRPDSPIPGQVPVPDIIRVRDLYLRARRHTGGEKMALRKRGAEGEESEDLSVPLRVEAPESAAPLRTRRKGQGVNTKAPAPKKIQSFFICYTCYPSSRGNYYPWLLGGRGGRGGGTSCHLEEKVGQASNCG